MFAVDYLARVGFDWCLDRLGGPTDPDLPDDPDESSTPAAVEAARLADHARVREFLLSEAPKPRSGDLDGAKWFALLTWPDRVGGFKTWAGQSTLPKIIASHQKRLTAAEGADLFGVRGVIRTKAGEGPSGFDPLTCQDAIDVGFSPSSLDMDIGCRPAVELLAVLGLEAVPLVSFGPRDVGFLHAGKVWRFGVEDRDGGYAKRWGMVKEHANAGG